MFRKYDTFYFAMLFVFTFGVIGAGAWWVIGATIYDGMRAKDWVRVQAELVSHGPGTVSYNYRFGEKRYHGDRLGSNVIGGTDNVDSWHDEMAEALNDARTGTRPLMVWVNPDKPEESMVDREIRWRFLLFASVFGLAFGGVGLGGLIVGIASLFPKRAKRRKRSDALQNVLGLWIFAFFWNAIAFPVGFLAVPQMIDEGEWMGLLIVIFPLIGLMLLWGAIHATWGLIRRGGASLTLADPSPQLGKPLSGHIEFAKGVKTGDNFRVRLEGRHVETGEDGSVRTVWTKEIQARVANSGSGPRIAFRFDPPPKSPANAWRLEAIAPERGTEVKYGFDLAIEPAVQDQEQELTAAVSAFADEQMLSGAGINLTSRQVEKFKELTPEQRAQVAKVLKWAPKAKVIVFWVIAAFIAFQIIGVVVAILND